MIELLLAAMGIWGTGLLIATILHLPIKWWLRRYGDEEAREVGEMSTVKLIKDVTQAARQEDLAERGQDPGMTYRQELKNDYRYSLHKSAAKKLERRARRAKGPQKAKLEARAAKHRRMQREISWD